MFLYTLLYDLNHDYKLMKCSMMSQSSQLPIDECEEWIWDILDCTKDCGFEYISGDGKEFLILNTNDFYADTKALYKIKRLTGRG